MPFYDESGKAIIPKSKPKEPEPEPTVKTKYFKPKTTSKSKPKSTPAPAPTTTKSPLSVKETEFGKTPKEPPKPTFDSNSAESMRTYETQPTTIRSSETDLAGTTSAPFVEPAIQQPTKTKSPLSVKETEFKEPAIQQPTVESSSIGTTTAHRRKLEQTGEFSDKDSLSGYKKGDVVSSSTPTYPEIYSKLSKSESNVEIAITGLKRPDTYYDPSQNMIVTGPLASHPSFKKITEEKIEELQTTKAGIGEQLFQVSKLESKGYQIEKTGEGEYKFFKTAEQVEKEEVAKEVERIRPFYYGSPIDKVIAWGHGVTTGLLSGEDPFGIPSAIQMATGDKEGALETKARAGLDITRAIEAGTVPFVLKMVSSPIALVGASYVGGALVSKGTALATGYAVSALGPTAGTAIKVAEIGAGVAMGGLAVHDVAKTYEEKGLPQAIGKASLYAIMAGMAYKGYKSVDRPANISAGEQAYYKKHPDQLKLFYGKKGELVSSEVKVDAFSSRGTPTESKQLTIIKKSIWKPAGKKRVGLLDAWSKKANLEYYQSLKDSKIRAFAGDKNAALAKGSTVDYYGVGGTSQRGVAVETTGTKPLLQSGDVQVLSGQSGVKGGFFKRIFTTKIVKFKADKDLTIKEAVGFGGIAQRTTKTVTLPSESIGNVPVSALVTNIAPAFPLSASGFLNIPVPVVAPAYSYTETVSPEMVSIKTVSPVESSISKRISKPSKPQETVVIPQYLEDFKSGISPVQRKMVDQLLNPPETITHGELEPPIFETDFSDTDIKSTPKPPIVSIHHPQKTTPIQIPIKAPIDISSEIQADLPVEDIGNLPYFEPVGVQDTFQDTKQIYDQQASIEKAVDFSFGKTRSKIPDFYMPKGNLGGWGGTDSSFGWLIPIERSRQHKVGDILKELKKGFNI